MNFNFNRILRSYKLAKLPISQERIAGTVTWDRKCPSGVNYQTHKFSFLDAVETAVNIVYAALCQSKIHTRQEIVWIKTGVEAGALLMTLPQAVIATDDERPVDELHFIGCILNRPIFLDPKQPKDEFLIGNEQFVVTGAIITSENVTGTIITSKET